MSVIPPPGAPTAQKKSGCWKWGIIGCLSSILILIIGVAGIAAIVFGAMKSSDVYRGALGTAKKDPRVITALGEPIDSGIWIIGSINVNNQSGNADIVFPLIGSKSRGHLHAVATRRNGDWQYSTLSVMPENGAAIDLLGDAAR